MPEQIQSMLILADGSTSWNVLFHLEQLVEKRREKKKRQISKCQFFQFRSYLSTKNFKVELYMKYNEKINYRNKKQEKRKQDERFTALLFLQCYYCICVSLLLMAVNSMEILCFSSGTSSSVYPFNCSSARQGTVMCFRKAEAGMHY